MGAGAEGRTQGRAARETGAGDGDDAPRPWRGVNDRGCGEVGPEDGGSYGSCGPELGLQRPHKAERQERRPQRHARTAGNAPAQLLKLTQDWVKGLLLGVGDDELEQVRGTVPRAAAGFPAPTFTLATRHPLEA